MAFFPLQAGREHRQTQVSFHFKVRVGDFLCFPITVSGREELSFQVVAGMQPRIVSVSKAETCTATRPFQFFFRTWAAGAVAGSGTLPGFGLTSLPVSIEKTTVQPSGLPSAAKVAAEDSLRSWVRTL